MVLSVSAVLLLLLVVVMLVRKGGLKAGHAVICVLLGFYLASSSLAPTISGVARSVADVVGGLKL